MIHRYIIVILLLSVMPLCINARVSEVQSFEGEINVGMSAPFKHIASEDNCAGIDAGLEVRYNFKQFPIGLGLMAGLYNPCRIRDEWGGATESYGGVMAGIIGEYNFRQGRRCNPYLGVGAGIANFNSGEFWGADACSTRMFLRPKIGVELFHHLRINFSATIAGTRSAGWSISIGGVIGGRPRKSQ